MNSVLRWFVFCVSLPLFASQVLDGQFPASAGLVEERFSQILEQFEHVARCYNRLAEIYGQTHNAIAAKIAREPHSLQNAIFAMFPRYGEQFGDLCRIIASDFTASVGVLRSGGTIPAGFGLNGIAVHCSALTVAYGQYATALLRNLLSLAREGNRMALIMLIQLNNRDVRFIVRASFCGAIQYTIGDELAREFISVMTQAFAHEEQVLRLIRIGIAV